MQGADQPLELAAAKSRSGHAEAGAGVLGIAAVLQRLKTGNVAPLLHLRSLNPHLASLLAAGTQAHAGSSGSRKQSLAAVVPRQAAAGVMEGAEEWHSGVSSFAFQVQCCMIHCVDPIACLATRCPLPLECTDKLLHARWLQLCHCLAMAAC